MANSRHTKYVESESAFGPKADLQAIPDKSPLIAISGHRAFRRGRTLGLIAGPAAVSGPSRTLRAVDAAGKGVRKPTEFRAEHTNFLDLRHMAAYIGRELGERLRYIALCGPC